MNTWEKLATDEELDKAIAALKENGISSVVVSSGEEAKEKVLSMLPEGAEVMNMTSVTVDKIGLSYEIMESGKFTSVKNELSKLDRAKDGHLMQQLGAAPEYAVGSVHAVTQDGKVMIASNTGSQLPAYAYGASHVIWVVGTQKIVKNLDEGEERLYNHTLPLESARAQVAYGLPEGYKSNVSKLLIVSREVNPNRITIVFVKELLGF
jgi:L-lactate utilization protein LutC